jgi:hypothetical protein
MSNKTLVRIRCVFLILFLVVCSCCICNKYVIVGVADAMGSVSNKEPSQKTNIEEKAINTKNETNVSATRTTSASQTFTADNVDQYIEEFALPKDVLNEEGFNNKVVYPRVRVAISADKLYHYLSEHPMSREIGSYVEYDIANEAIKETLRENSYKIVDWMNNSNKPRLRLKKRFFKVVGYVVKKDDKDAKSVDKAIVILLREQSNPNSKKGFSVVSTYPTR